MNTRESVIVIGAGVAGLACASDLLRRGFEVVVLEARARVGGRVWSDERLGFPVDLGASWIMGEKTNPLTALARAAGAEVVPTDWDSLAVFDKGKRVSDDDLDEIGGQYEALLDEIREAAPKLRTDISIAQAIERALAGEKLSPAERRACNFAFAMLGLDAAADMDELGVKGQEQDIFFDGANALVKGGYALVPRYLARGLTVHMEQVVTRITHGSAGVTVDTQKGSFEAARCVVALPLGVLQSDKLSFAPALPADKRAVIGRLHMGTLDKVVLLLPRRVIPASTDFLGRMGDEPERFPMFLNIERLSGRPALIGFVAGKLARSLEARSDAEVVEQAMRSLRELLGASVPAPTASLVVRWSADPFAGGSYSYVPVGAAESDRDILAAPVGERLYFCGEATMRNRSGTVHGAYLSGLRAAARLAGDADPHVAAGRSGHRGLLKRRRAPE